MKRQIIPHTLVLLFFAASGIAGCSKSAVEGGTGTGTGTVALHISATRATGESPEEGTSTYDPLEYQTIRIYNASDELIRRYTAASQPERLELLAGNYSVDAEVGEQVPASFEKKFYHGRQEFSVTAGQTEGVEVKCTRQNVAAKVAFDASIAEKFGSSAKVLIAAAAAEQASELGKTYPGDVHKAGGLNWGFSNGEPLPNDAYIKIPIELIRKNPLMFPPKNNESNEYVDVIWDDGTRMQMLLEGTQTVDDIEYPKQISTYKSKKELGLYLRKRIGDAIGIKLIIPTDSKDEFRTNINIYKDKLITKEMLEKYGRSSINIKLIGEGTYYFDFSRKDREGVTNE